MVKVINVYPVRLIEKDKMLSCQVFEQLKNKKFNSIEELQKNIPFRTKIIEDKIYNFFSYIKTFRQNQSHKRYLVFSSSKGSFVIVINISNSICA